jgi:hypothetical protein
MKAFLLPMVLDFMVVLAVTGLPHPYRLSGTYRWIVGEVTGLTSSLAVYVGLRGM